MRVLVQRVTSASVSVGGAGVGAIRPEHQGLLALVGGNLLVQADQPDGSRVAAAGFSVALVAIAVVGAAALVTRIGGSSSGSPSGSTG